MQGIVSATPTLPNVSVKITKMAKLTKEIKLKVKKVFILSPLRQAFITCLLLLLYNVSTEKLGITTQEHTGLSSVDNFVERYYIYRWYRTACVVHNDIVVHVEKVCNNLFKPNATYFSASKNQRIRF